MYKGRISILGDEEHGMRCKWFVEGMIIELTWRTVQKKYIVADKTL
jgi:hypothetical protein